MLTRRAKAGSTRPASDNAALSEATCKGSDGREVGRHPRRAFCRSPCAGLLLGGPAAAWAGSPRRPSFFSCPALTLPSSTTQRRRSSPGRGSSKASPRPRGGSPPILCGGRPPKDVRSPSRDKNNDDAAPRAHARGSRTSLRSRPRPKRPCAFLLAPVQSPAGLRRSGPRFASWQSARRGCLPDLPPVTRFATRSDKSAFIVRGPKAPRLPLRVNIT